MPTVLDVLTPRGRWSAAEAARFAFGPQEASPDGTLRLAFTRDDLQGTAGAVVRQAGDGRVELELDAGDGDPAAVRGQVARILSLDHDATGFQALAGTDPVLAPALGRHPGLRPVLFSSPYEAACWAVLSLRRRREQARRLRAGLSEALGEAHELAGATLHAFPPPERLLDAERLPGLAETPAERLRAVARAALGGQLDPDYLTRAEPAVALERLQRIPGLGPFYAGLVLARASGAADVLPAGEPRVRRAAAAAAGDLRLAEDEAAFAALAERWRPWRTWACVLLRVDGEGEKGA